MEGHSTVLATHCINVCRDEKVPHQLWTSQQLESKFRNILRKKKEAYHACRQIHETVKKRRRNIFSLVDPRNIK